MPLTPPVSPRISSSVDTTPSSASLTPGNSAISAATQNSASFTSTIKMQALPMSPTLSLELAGNGQPQRLLTPPQSASKASISYQDKKDTSQSEWFPLKRLTFESATRRGGTFGSIHEPADPGKSDFPAWLNATPWESIEQPLTIVTGPNGSGKSQLLKLILRQIGSCAIYKDSTLLSQPNVGSTDIDKVVFPEILTDAKKVELIAQVKEQIMRLLAKPRSFTAQECENTAHRIAHAIVRGKSIEEAKHVSDESILLYINQVSMQNLSNMEHAFSVLFTIFSAYKERRKESTKHYRDIDYLQTLKARYQSETYKHEHKEGTKFSHFIADKAKLAHLIDYVVTQQTGRPYWDDINELFAKNDLDLKMEFKEKTRNQPEIYFTRHNQPIEIHELSAGEQLILEIFAWQFYTSGLSNDAHPRVEVQRSKIKMLLLDEPDRHFDPKLCKLFMSCLEYISKTNKVQIIMTTHRTDTLAYAPEGSIFTIKRDTAQGPARIEPTPRLTALFKLTPNLREITNFHIEVLTEAFDDATFYQKIYQQLLKLSEKRRNEGKMSPEAKSTILSRRLPLSFYSVATKEGGRGGGCTVIFQTIQRKVKALQHQNSFKELELPLISREISRPFGLIDADKYLTHPQKITLSGRIDAVEYPEVERQVISGRRYSLENYLYDPALLFSLLSKAEIEQWFTEDAEFRDCALNCQTLLAEKAEEKLINDAFQIYFRHFLKLFVFDSRNQGSVKEHYYSIYRYLGITPSADSSSDSPYRLQQKNILLVIEKLQFLQKFDLTPLTSTDLDALKAIEDLSKIMPKLSTHMKNSIYDKLKDESIKKSTGLIEKFITDLGLTDQVIGKSQQEKEKQVIELLMGHSATPVEITSPDDGKTRYKINYPGFFIYARGHNLEDCVLTCVVKKEPDLNFKTWLIGKVMEHMDNLLLPKDLVDIIYDLNTRVREQARAVLKPSI